jgi:MADS-box transcription factor, plant
MGQDLSGLGVKGLQNLENQLEMSICCIRTKKVTMLTIFYPSQDFFVQK